MTDYAKLVPVASPAVQPPTSSAAGGGFRDSKASEEAERAARYRLVIEEGPSAGSFIYKTMDRLTGEVVRQFPREQVVDLMNAFDYSAGTVIDTHA